MRHGTGGLLGGAGTAALLWLLSPLTGWADGTAVSHPVFRPDPAAVNAGQLRAGLETLLRLDDARVLDLIPTRSGFTSADCPNCQGGSQGRQLAWTIDDPGVLTCRYCGEKYPSPRYPEDKVLRVKDPLGRVQEYPYYADATGHRRFFQAHGWRQARDYFMLAAYDLARLYHATGDRRAAARAALIIDRFAQLYPGFIVTLDVSDEVKGFQEAPPYNPQGGKWGRWYFDEIPTPLVYAYDLIYDSGALEEAGRRGGVDAKRRIEEDLFRAAVRHVRTYPEYYGNPSPRIYEGLAAIGRVIGEPGFVHDAVRRIGGLFENRFFFDGMWNKGAYGYHRMTLLGLESAIKAVSGQTDSPGYADPGDGRRFEALDLEKEVPMLARARRATERYRYPDGRYFPVHDSWSRLNGVELKSDPLPASEPALWPGMGHAILGRGRGPDQIQAGLHFGGGYGHHHDDSLNLSLFACGEELLPDFGYTHTRFRYWVKSTLGHNTLMVDGLEQDAGSEARPSDGNLALFLDDGPDFQVLEASAPRVYPGRVKEYSRTLILVGVDEAKAYLLDIFAVAGGGRHELAFHGSADREQILSLPGLGSPREASLLPPGARFEPPAGENETGRAGGVNPAYGFLTDVRTAPAPEVLAATFRPKTGAGASLRIWTLPPPGSAIYSALAPSIRPAEEDDARVDQFRLPLFFIRKEGQECAETYVSVLEPFRDRPLIREVRALEVEGGGLGVRVSGPGWTDILLFRPEGAGAGETSGGGLRLEGRIGWARTRNGRVEALRLVDGTGLSFGDRRIAGPAAAPARVLGVRRKAAGGGIDALEVDAPLTPGPCPGGRTVIVRHADGSSRGLLLERIMREEGRTFLVLADEPGFETTPDGGCRFLFFPKRTVGGAATCRIPGILTRTWTNSR
ncbi:MAG TPA: heparinase II/III family protein [Candidatus Aminicenantes bacterium]|nr:heparinase II/III family protein [Candidatus Aminicenantes bacterium]HRY65839.1 heparinase II/III family protein [Candidatus Aminicenantes bacterium]HRZ72835.1 heparinase II/III family protein [Candidatus Aminicenantes bacterium]